MSAIGSIMAARHEDTHPEILLPVGEALLAGGSEADVQMGQYFLQMLLAMTAQRTVDEDVRVRWFKGPIGREMVRLAGPLEGMAMRPGETGDGLAGGLQDSDTELLRLLTEGLTNHEISERLDVTEDALVRRLGEMFVRIGTSSRAEATAFAFREGVV
jgi:DNA-binding NarL/FixJ family response regulator